MAVNITRTTSGDAEVVVASDQLTGNDFAATAVDVAIDYTAAINRIADSLESIDYALRTLQFGQDPFGSVALYKLFIEQGGILDNSSNVDGETMAKAKAELKVYTEKIAALIATLNQP